MGHEYPDEDVSIFSDSYSSLQAMTSGKKYLQTKSTFRYCKSCY